MLGYVARSRSLRDATDITADQSSSSSLSSVPLSVVVVRRPNVAAMRTHLGADCDADSSQSCAALSNVFAIPLSHTARRAPKVDETPKRKTNIEQEVPGKTGDFLLSLNNWNGLEEVPFPGPPCTFASIFALPHTISAYYGRCLIVLCQSVRLLSFTHNSNSV